MSISINGFPHLKTSLKFLEGSTLQKSPASSMRMPSRITQRSKWAAEANRNNPLFQTLTVWQSNFMPFMQIAPNSELFHTWIFLTWILWVPVLQKKFCGMKAHLHGHGRMETRSFISFHGSWHTVAFVQTCSSLDEPWWAGRLQVRSGDVVEPVGLEHID